MPPEGCPPSVRNRVRHGPVRAVRLLQTTLALRAWLAIPLRTLEAYRLAAIDPTMLAVSIQRAAGRADTGPRDGVVVEVSGYIAWRLLRLTGFVIERIRFGEMLVLLGETLIALAHLIVGNQGWDVLVVERDEIVLTVVASVGGDECVGLAKIRSRFDNGQQ